MNQLNENDEISLKNEIISFDERVNGIVYCAINLINNKFYIGKTNGNLRRRKTTHESRSLKSNENNYFHNALKKYGIENFEWGILFIATDVHDLLAKENDLILKFNSFDRKVGYNSKCIIHGITHHSDATKEKISKKAKERLSIPENNPFFGKKHSEELKQRFSQERKGTGSGSDNGWFGHQHSEDSKKCMSDARIEWSNIAENKIKLQLQNQHRTLIYCVDAHLMFNSMKDAANYFGINNSTFKAYIKKSEFIFGHRFIDFKNF